MGWRDMTEDEVARLPQARLGGALLWMVLAAAALCLTAIVGALSAPQALRAIGGRYTIAVGFVALWSAVFVVMTLVRLGATPLIVSLGLLGWIIYRFAVALMTGAGWPLSVDHLGELLLAAGLCGYMAEGVRPNAYYRRRLHAP